MKMKSSFDLSPRPTRKIKIRKPRQEADDPRGYTLLFRLALKFAFAQRNVLILIMLLAVVIYSNKRVSFLSEGDVSQLLTLRIHTERTGTLCVPVPASRVIG